MTLSNFEIEKIIKRLRPDFHFLGAISNDECPSFHKNCCAVLNIQDAKDEHGNNLPGSHWVACGVDRLGVPWYFDSFGLHPLPSFESSIQKDEHDAVIRKRIYYNPIEVQATTSSYCGYFAIAACVACSKDAKKGMKELLSKLDSPVLKHNDRIVKRLIYPNEL